MKLYLILAKRNLKNDAETPDTDASWVGSQADAATKRKSLVADGFKRAEISTHEIDVPTNKEGLMAFLNLAAGGADIAAASEKLTAK